MSLCNWEKYDSFTKRLIGEATNSVENNDAVAVDIFNLQALPVTYEFIAGVAKRNAEDVALALEAKRQNANLSRPAVRRKKIRIGYLLAYTWFHSLPLVLREVIRGHDRDRFEVYGYSIDIDNGSEFSRSYRGAFDQFRDVSNEFSHAAATQIHEDEIDILIDVAGQTAVNCMSILAFHPAPIVAHFLGYSITTGARYVDYLITDRISMPEELAQYGSEMPVYLPHTFMATTRPEISTRSFAREHFELPEGAFVISNFNHPCKFEPVVFDAWMRILKRIPNAVLWMGDWIEGTQRNLYAEAEARGVASGRLVFAGIVEHDVHCARLQLADLAIDTLYHCGGITTIDALWAGLPVLTVLGDTPASRLGATLVTAAGMPELVVRSLDEYENRTVDLAQSPGELAALRKKLWDQRLSCPLFDGPAYVRNLERGYEVMWENHLAGGAPCTIDVSPDRTD